MNASEQQFPGEAAINYINQYVREKIAAETPAVQAALAAQLTPAFQEVVSLLNPPTQPE